MMRIGMAQTKAGFECPARIAAIFAPSVLSAPQSACDTEGIKMKINSKDFRVRPGKRIKLKEWPTIVKPFCKSKVCVRGTAGLTRQWLVLSALGCPN